MKSRTVSRSDLDALEAKVVEGARFAVGRLTTELDKCDALTALARLKFSMFGCDPLDSTRPLNLVEQLNQTFTYLATIKAARWLFSHHSDLDSLTLNLGTASGLDITGDSGKIAAEVFAATHPDSNDKLRNDIERVSKTGAATKYVFYLSTNKVVREVKDVTVIRFDPLDITRAASAAVDPIQR